jgi:3-methyladenine DNA glycosylase AlkD
MDAHEELIVQLQARLDAVASAKTKAWWEKYLRYVIPFRGVGIPEIRQQLADWRAANGIARWPVEDQLRLALRFFESGIAEDKLAGILFLQDYLYDRFGWETLFPQYEQLYARGLIFDWNTCDWFCVRVLGPTIAVHGLPCAEVIAAWRHASDLWQARSSVVAFVPVSSDERFHPLIFEACAALIRRDERFAKTAVGWILHDLSKLDQAPVTAFIEHYLDHFSAEALKNALKYYGKDEQHGHLQRRAAVSAQLTGQDASTA